MSEFKRGHLRQRTPEGRQVIRTAPGGPIDVPVRGARRIKTLYDLLGVRSDADDDSIEKAYRQAIWAYHPDRHGGDPESAALSQEIVAAVAVLRDPNQRAAYDLQLRRERRRRREWTAAAILGVAATAIIGAGFGSGRFVLYSNPATTISENRSSVAADEVPANEVVDRKSSQSERSDESAPAPTASAEPLQRPLEASENVKAPPSQRHLETSEIALLIKRGEELMAAGNIAAARMMFQPAAEAGEPTAAFALAKTYDPAVLEKLGAKGTTPNIALAQQWYEKAKALDSTAALGRSGEITR
jgi:curved DNA-binding protein CbpA